MSQMNVSDNGGVSDKRNAFLFAAILILSSFAVYVVASIYHPSGIDPNNHPAVFAQYAASSGWTLDHAVWFVQTSLLIAGILVLFYALDLSRGLAAQVARLGVASAAVAIALTALRDAVDGVVLKRAVDAWVSAPEVDKAARFASAETARWLEEASASYQGFVLGLTLILLAVLIVWSARAPRSVGLLLGVGGVGYLAFGWVLGVSGFAPEGAVPSYIAALSPTLAGLWLLISAWRMPQPGAESTGQEERTATLAGQGGI